MMDYVKWYLVGSDNLIMNLNKYGEFAQGSNLDHEKSKKRVDFPCMKIPINKILIKCTWGISKGGLIANCNSARVKETFKYLFSNRFHIVTITI